MSIIYIIVIELETNYIKLPTIAFPSKNVQHTPPEKHSSEQLALAIFDETAKIISSGTFRTRPAFRSEDQSGAGD